MEPNMNAIEETIKDKVRPIKTVEKEGGAVDVYDDRIIVKEDVPAIPATVRETEISKTSLVMDREQRQSRLDELNGEVAMVTEQIAAIDARLDYWK